VAEPPMRTLWTRGERAWWPGGACRPHTESLPARGCTVKCV